ncbi:MAG: poly(R)-hydroxyalkanoic acid synthase subunit PhaE, partial [Pseudomonadales bacterium]
QWERAFDEYSNKVMGTDEFSKAMNQMQSMQMEFQRTFQENMAKQLAAFNIPNREEVLKIAEDITALDRRLLQIEKSLAQLTSGKGGKAKAKATKKKGPARTRKPPAAKDS